MNQRKWWKLWKRVSTHLLSSLGSAKFFIFNLFGVRLFTTSIPIGLIFNFKSFFFFSHEFHLASGAGVPISPDHGPNRLDSCSCMHTHMFVTRPLLLQHRQMPYIRQASLATRPSQERQVSMPRIPNAVQPCKWCSASINRCTRNYYFQWWMVDGGKLIEHDWDFPFRFRSIFSLPNSVSWWFLFLKPSHAWLLSTADPKWNFSA